MSRRIFIVGVGRSGTSLLQAILGSHSKIEFVPETSFLRRYVFEGVASESTDAFWQSVTSDERVARLAPNWEKIIDGDSDDLAFQTYEKLTQTASPATGDKDPRLVEFIDCLYHHWDRCKVIHLFRDPRDVLTSKKKANWSKNRTLFFHLVAGAAQYRLATQARSSSKNLKHVRYESLITSPNEVLKNLCLWLGVEFEPEMLNFGSTAEKLTSQQELSWKKETFGPLLNSNQGKWKHSLSGFEIKATEIACSRAMSDGKYGTAQLKLSPLQSTAAFVTGHAVKFIAALYVFKVNRRNGILVARIKKND